MYLENFLSIALLSMGTFKDILRKKLESLCVTQSTKPQQDTLHLPFIWTVILTSSPVSSHYPKWRREDLGVFCHATHLILAFAALLPESNMLSIRQQCFHYGKSVKKSENKVRNVNNNCGARFCNVSTLVFAAVRHFEYGEDLGDGVKTSKWKT